MSFFALRNLSSTEVNPCVPWEFGLENLVNIPPECFGDKKARDKWANTPKTTHQMYSCIQGVNPNIRINSKENPPHSFKSFAADVDCKLTRPELDGALARMGEYKPNYIETTLSGNFRLVWIFEVPVCLLGDSEYTQFLLEHIHELIPYRQVPGVDEGAVASASRYYTNGCRWEKVHDKPFPKDLLIGWVMDISAKYNWDGVAGAAKLPMDVVIPLLKEKYPRFADWSGDFKVGAQGPTFWEAESLSPKSAVVRETGIQSFAQHAEHHPFMSWADFFGAAFVNEFKKKQMGAAVEGIHYDGKQYIRKQAAGEWVFGGTDEVFRYLRTECGLSDRRPKGMTCSPVDEAVMYIQNNAFITSAGSFSFYQKGLMKHQGKRFLNIHTRDVLAPAPGTQKWGDKFPFLAKFYDNWLTSGEALEAYLSHLSYAYNSAFIRVPQPGQVSFFVGPPNCGKTLNTRYIIGELFNGYAECQDWIMGRDQFNSELFEVFIWAIDDNTMGIDAKMHRIYTEMLKRACANQAFRSNEKFRKAGLIDWSGRIFGSCNDDMDSLRGIPEIGLSNLDKLNLYRCQAARTDGFVFPERAELTRILAVELPYFGRYLLDYEIPARRLGKDTRYGPIHFHDPSIVTEANQSSQAAGIGEQVDEWMRQYFIEKHPDKDCWSGTAYQLYKSMAIDCHMVEAMGRTTAETLSKMLPVLAQKGFEIKICGGEFRRVFTICRGTRYPKGPVAKAPAQTANNPYEKQ